MMDWLIIIFKLISVNNFTCGSWSSFSFWPDVRLIWRFIIICKQFRTQIVSYFNVNCLQTRNSYFAFEMHWVLANKSVCGHSLSICTKLRNVTLLLVGVNSIVYCTIAFKNGEIGRFLRNLYHYGNNCLD